MHIDGTSAAHIVVSETTITSQRSRSRRPPQQLGEVRRARLLLALDEELERDRRRGRAAGCKAGSHAEGVEEDLTLVVGGAAGQQPAVPLGRLERRRVPLRERFDRLDVVMAVDQHDGRRGVGRRPLREHGGKPAASSAPVSQTSAAGNPSGAGARPATRADRRTSACAPGRAEIDGIVSHSFSAAKNSPGSCLADVCHVSSMPLGSSLGHRAPRPAARGDRNDRRAIRPTGPAGAGTSGAGQPRDSCCQRFCWELRPCAPSTGVLTRSAPATNRRLRTSFSHDHDRFAACG